MTMVSVVMVTYNHEKYIEKAIDGVLSQKTNYDVELIIADDNSPDNTEEIVNKIIKTHPYGSRIRYNKNATNKGMMRNFSFALKLCQGKYIALCDGDDYWTDPLKLQKQVDFLEKNSDYNFSMGRYKRLNQKNGRVTINKESIGSKKLNSYDVSDYLKKKFSHTSTFLYRKLKGNYPDWFEKVHAGDQSVVIIHTNTGNIKFHTDIFSVYRMHNTSISKTTSAGKVYRKFDETLNNWNEFLDFRYEKIIFIRKIENNLLYLYAEAKNLIPKTVIKIILESWKKIKIFFY